MKLYLAQHFAGTFSIAFYGIWCKRNNVHMFHDRRLKALSFYLGDLSVLKCKNDNYNLLTKLIQSEKVKKLLIFGSFHPKAGKVSYFSKGLINIASQPNAKTRAIILNPHFGKRMLISEVLPLVSVKNLADAFNRLQSRIKFSCTNEFIVPADHRFSYWKRELHVVLMFMILPLCLLVFFIFIVKGRAVKRCDRSCAR